MPLVCHNPVADNAFPLCAADVRPFGDSHARGPVDATHDLAAED
jgi:hypothetical protein